MGRANWGHTMNVPVRRLDFLDSIRAVAILLVLGFHAVGASVGLDRLPWHGWFPDFSAQPALLGLYPLTFGGVGVPIFFAVSGFCIHLSHRQSGESGFRAFYLRRAFRIYPPYLVALVLFALFFPLTRLDLATDAARWQLAAHAGLFHNLASPWFFGINPSFWSIAAEAQLYLVYPLLLALVRRFGWPGALGLLAGIELGIRLLSGLWFLGQQDPLPRMLTDGPLAYWFSWAMGAHVAEMMVQGRKPALAKVPTIVWALAALTCAHLKPLTPLTFPFVAVGTAMWISRRVGEPTTGGAPYGLRLFRSIGLWSYSIYLFHQPIITWVANKARSLAPAGGDNPWVSLGAVSLTILPLILLCGLAYRWLEAPAGQLGKRLAARVRHPPSTPTKS
jgi:peptidoglycan/LPS O-acetylase OafA/YrhL